MKKSLLFTLITLILMIGNSALLPAQIKLATADSLYQAKDWPNASKVYESILKQGNVPSGAYIHFHLGACYNQLGKYNDAITEYRKETGYSRQPSVCYKIAAAFSKLNQRDSCYKWLKASADAGYYGYEMMMKDDDFANLRNENSFTEIAAQIKMNAFPCLDDSVYRQFNFWIGDWRVYGKNGFQVGTSKIESILGKCAILENWTDYFGNQGKSFNTYNSNNGEWEQIWVDDQGTLTEYVNGTYKDNTMIFKTLNIQQKDGSYQMMRLTFFNQGKDQVRQFGEVSDDGGNTWLPRYDFIYKRINSK